MHHANISHFVNAPKDCLGPRWSPKPCELLRFLVSYRLVNGKVLLSADEFALTPTRQVASLNEFRDFFGLKRHETMEDINPDPKIADILRSLYDHPDMVELYPGLFLEEGKPDMNPGCGVSRTVEYDA